MSQNDVGAAIDQLVRKFAVLRADIVPPVRGPMDRHHDVVNLGPQTSYVLLDQEWIHGSDPGTAGSRECGLAHVTELRIAKEAKLDTIPRKYDGLSSFGKIATAPDMPKRRPTRENAAYPETLVLPRQRYGYWRGSPS